ncbi:MAG: tRNA threonylcarbamoyladenosine dehydratase [Succinivibrio sp.]|nr:tRNA threonylcarbamoyladenosine dehydratase [Succinivibrio sp.]
MIYDLKQMFRGIRALYGDEGFEKLQNSHVMIIGVGGVGSWLAESLCRSAVGSLTLIDFDRVEQSNSNRQLHATVDSVGLYKVDILAKRFVQINPQIKVNPIKERLTPDNIDKILKDCPPFVADAIDDIEAKAYVDSYLFHHRIEFITAGGAGGRTDPRFLKIADVAEAKGDALIARLRNLLRQHYSFPKGGAKFGFPCTYSCEKPVYSPKEGYVSGDLPAFGASMTVTATAGMLAASWILRQIIGNNPGI